MTEGKHRTQSNNENCEFSIAEIAKGTKNDQFFSHGLTVRVSVRARQSMLGELSDLAGEVLHQMERLPTRRQPLSLVKVVTPRFGESVSCVLHIDENSFAKPHYALSGEFETMNFERMEEVAEFFAKVGNHVAMRERDYDSAMVTVALVPSTRLPGSSRAAF